MVLESSSCLSGICLLSHAKIERKEFVLNNEISTTSKLIIIPIKNIKLKNSVPNNLSPTQPLSLRYYVPWFDGASIGDDLDHMALLNLMKCS